MHDITQILLPALTLLYFIHATSYFSLDKILIDVIYFVSLNIIVFFAAFLFDICVKVAIDLWRLFSLGYFNAHKRFQIFVKLLDGRTITLDVESETTIDEVTNFISERTGIPASHQVLFFLGPLRRQRTIKDYNIQPNTTLHLTIRIVGGFNKKHKCSMASCKVAGVFQCTNCVCSKSKSCSKNCACRGLCRGAPDVNVASIEVNEVVEDVTEEIHFRRDDETLHFPFHSRPEKQTNVKSTSFFVQLIQLIVLFSLFVICCQQAIFLNEAWNEKIEEFFVSKDHYSQFCENKKLTNQRFAEECSRLSIVINTSPFMNAVTKVVSDWKSCVLMSCTELLSDLFTFTANKLILIVAIFFGTLWLISFYYGEKKVNFEDYMQAKLSKRYSRELSPLELNVPTHQERVDQLRLPY